MILDKVNREKAPSLRQLDHITHIKSRFKGKTAQIIILIFYTSYQRNLDEIGDIHRHFIYLCGVVLLDVSQNSNVVTLHKVDSHTLAAKST